MLCNLKGILKGVKCHNHQGLLSCQLQTAPTVCSEMFNNSTIHYLFNSLTAERSSIQHIYRIQNQCNMKQCFPLAAVYSRRSYVPIMPVLRGRHQSQACNCADSSHRKIDICFLNLFHGPKCPVTMATDSNCTRDVLVKYTASTLHTEN